jgi:toxin ParE1/3/4
VKRLDIQAAARNDLRDIYLYSVDEFGQRTAEAYLNGLRKRFDLLSGEPLIGVVYPDIVPEMRVFGYRSHRIFYRVEPKALLVVRVLHKMRDFVAVFG